MGVSAVVKDGKVVETDSQASLKKTTSEKNGMDKDAFLQLLVAQMRYQDPLQPTSNTEFVTQYAQFSQVEQIQNMAATSELARASALVGKEVYVKTTNSAGVNTTINGRVDYVVFEANKAYLSINESLYSLDDLDTIVDLDYKAAYDKAFEFTVALNKLPTASNVSMLNAEDIDKLEETYKNMTEYEKSFVAEETVTRLNKYVERLKEVRLLAEEASKEAGTGTETENI